MSKIELALSRALEDMSFWQQLVEHLKSPEPGIAMALQKARERYNYAFEKWNQAKKQ